MSSDPLADAAVPSANKRSGGIDPHLRDALAQASSSGALARAGGHASGLVHRFRKRRIKKLGPPLGNRSVALRVWSYWRAGQA
eukprot:8490518-Alexandrium_andersonii.AAC.1